MPTEHCEACKYWKANTETTEEIRLCTNNGKYTGFDYGCVNFEPQAIMSPEVWASQIFEPTAANISSENNKPIGRQG
jgi:hypothetical protein